MTSTHERITAALGRLYQVEQEIHDIEITAPLSHWTDRQRIDEARRSLEAGRISLSQILNAAEHMVQLATQDKARTQIARPSSDRRRL